MAFPDFKYLYALGFTVLAERYFTILFILMPSRNKPKISFTLSFTSPSGKRCLFTLRYPYGTEPDGYSPFFLIVSNAVFTFFDKSFEYIPFTIFFNGTSSSSPDLLESYPSVTAMNLTLKNGNTLSI